MIILEGPDNAGKTTLAEELSARLGWPVRHSGGPVKDYQDINSRMVRVRLSKNVIWDRVPAISEHVYGPILRGTDHGAESFHTWLQSADIHIIYCRPDDKYVLNMALHRVSDKADAEHITKVNERQQEIVAAYDQLMTKFPHHRYDWTAK